MSSQIVNIHHMNHETACSNEGPHRVMRALFTFWSGIQQQCPDRNLSTNTRTLSPGRHRSHPYLFPRRRLRWERYAA